MPPKVDRREELVARARGHLAATGHPRLVMTALMLAAIGAAWLASAGLLRLGVDPMWARYPLAVLAGYGVLLGMLGAWVAARLVAETRQAEDPEGLFATGLAALALGGLGKKWVSPPDVVTESKEARRWWHHLDCPSSFDLGSVEHPGAVLVAVVIGGLAIAVVGTIMVLTSPQLLAELWVDGVGPRLDVGPSVGRASGWIGTAVRGSWGSAVFLALVLAFVGWELGHYVPGARTLGDAWSGQHSRLR